MHSPDGRMVRETIPARLIPRSSAGRIPVSRWPLTFCKKRANSARRVRQDRLTVWNAAGEQLVVLELGE